MDIVLLSWWYHEYCTALANALSQKHNVTLMLPEEYAEYLNEKKSKKLNIYTFKKYRLRDPRNMLSIKKILKQIETINPQVVHLQDGYPWLSFFLKKIQQPIITTLHDPKQHLGEEKIWETFRDKVTKKHTTRYIVHGKFLKNQLSQHLKVQKDIIDSIPHGNFEIYVPKSITTKKTKEKQILFFGRIWPYKGVQYLIQAEKYLKGNYKIIIAGTGEDIEHYRKKATEKVEFINRYIDHKEIPKIFSQADVVVLPYVEASQSGVVPLAYAFKKPVIVTKVGSIPEVVQDNKTGLLIPPKNARALAKAINKIISSPALAKKMGQAGFTYSKKELSWQHVAKLTAETYEKCLRT